MPKFYVSCGDLQEIVVKETPWDAAVAAFEKLDEYHIEKLSKVTLVSEHGFDSDADDDSWLVTLELLEETDQVGNYKSTDWLDNS